MTVTLMAALAAGEWVVADGAETPARREASGLVAALLQWHLERGLRSLGMVDRGTMDAPIDLPLAHPSTDLKGARLANGSMDDEPHGDRLLFS
jgi:DNA repair protein RecO (recombination protein O)